MIKMDRSYKVTLSYVFVCTVFALAAVPASALTSDDFSQPAFDTQLWSFVNPGLDAVFQQADGLLTVTVPGGSPHFPGVNGNTAVRLLQPLADGDFGIEIKFESLPAQPTQLQGLIVQQDAANYLLLDLRMTRTGMMAVCTTVTANFPTVRGMIPVAPATGLRLGLDRQGDSWSGRYALDDQQWVTAFVFEHALAATAAGPVAGNAGHDDPVTDLEYDDPATGDKAADNPAPPFTVRVDYLFDTDNPIVPEDGVTVTGLRTFADLQALYLFSQGSGEDVFDYSAAQPRLDLQIPDTAGVTWLAAGGLRLDTPTLLAAAGPADKINTACVASDEITLEVWVDPATTEQSGPARILTVSGDPSNRNATLSHGQWSTLPKTVFDARLRTTTTSDNGQPDLVTPAGSLSGQLQHVVYTRDATGTARIYVDGAEAASGTADGSLDNWDPTYALGIGAELDGTRGWLGTIHLAAVYSRALDPIDVQNHFVAGPDGGVLPALAPVVALRGLTPGDRFYFDETIALHAVAGDADGTVAEVSFFAGETLLADVTAPPYTFDWTQPTPGSHQIRAVVTDNEGRQGVTKAIPVLVEVRPEFLGASFVSDDFSGASVDPRWTVTDGTGGATVAQSGGHLIIDLPPLAQDPWDSAAEAVFAHQTGDPGDLALAVKLATTDFSGGAFGGLRCAGSDGQGVQLIGEHRDGAWTVSWGQAIAGGSGYLGAAPITTAPDGLWLQVRRSSDDWTLLYSDDGHRWFLAAEIFQPMTLDRTGIIGGALAASGAAPAVAFDYAFNLAAPINPEDGEGGDVTGPAIGPVSVVPGLDQAVLTWQTAEDAFFRVAYGTTTSYESGLLLGEFFATDHEVTLPGLAQGTIYHFQVTCIDTAGNVSSAVDQIFHTDLEPALSSGPGAGDVYREIRLPIGQVRDDWRVTDPAALNPGAAAFLPNPVLELPVPALAGAVRAELIIDRWGGHPGTSNKRIRLNGASWLHLPEPAGITGAPAECYMYQDNLMIEIPLDQLQDGSVTLEGTADNQVCNSFNWGQWGWYGAIMRIYYDGSVAHPTGAILTPTVGSTITDAVDITVDAAGAVSAVAAVEVLAWYDGYDIDGDGIFAEWQGEYRGDKRASAVATRGIVGSDDTAPYEMTWDVTWIPDQQPGTVALQARIRDQDGVWYVTDFVTGLSLDHLDRQVKQYRLVDVPRAFWVRGGQAKTATFEIPAQDDLALATAARLTASTWNGSDTGVIDVNGLWSVTSFGANHFHAHNEFGLAVGALVPGVNEVTISATSFDHGMEMMWPGPVVTVSYTGGVPTSATTSPLTDVALAWRTPVVSDGTIELVLEATGATAPIRSLQLDLDGTGDGGVLAVRSELAEAGDLAWTTVDGKVQVTFSTTVPVSLPERLFTITVDPRALTDKSAFTGRLAANGAAPVDLPATELPVQPVRFALAPNYPNPFNPVTRIDFALPVSGPVRLRIHDLHGKVVRTLVDEQMPLGFHFVDWRGDDDQGRRVASGVYFYRMEAAGFNQTRKLMLVK